MVVTAAVAAAAAGTDSRVDESLSGCAGDLNILLSLSLSQVLLRGPLWVGSDTLTCMQLFMLQGV